MVPGGSAADALDAPSELATRARGIWRIATLKGYLVSVANLAHPEAGRSGWFPVPKTQPSRRQATRERARGGRCPPPFVPQLSKGIGGKPRSGAGGGDKVPGLNPGPDAAPLPR